MSELRGTHGPGGHRRGSRRGGRSRAEPAPLRDSFIGATARCHGLTVVTRNERDLVRFGVPILNPWTDAA